MQRLSRLRTRRLALVPFLAAALLASACLGWGAAQQGVLESSDERLESGEYFDLHLVPGRAGERVVVALESTEFDVYLIVLAPSGAPLAQFDDTAGHGTNLLETLELSETGDYAFGVTSALPGETGAYVLAVSPEPQAATMQTPTTPAPTTTAQTPDAFAGSFSDGQLTVQLEAAGEAVTGFFVLGEGRFEASGTALAGVLTGTFTSGGQAFGFNASLEGDALLLETGGVRYLLGRLDVPQPVAPDAPLNPLAAPPALTGAPPVPERVAPTPLLSPQPGFVNGTVFDTLGRPLAGAGVLVTGTTFAQGQYTSFETTTGPDGTYALRVPDGRYAAKAWVDTTFGGRFFSRLLHPLSGSPYTEVDSTDGGTLDFEWRLSGLTAYSTPPGSEASDFYGASVNLSYCGLPADAYCDARYEAFPNRPIAPGGAQLEVTLVPTSPRIDGTPGETLVYRFRVEAQDPEYPYGGAPNPPPGYADGGGGRTVLGADWEYHSTDLNDVPLGSYDLSVTAIHPDGSRHQLRVGLEPDDVEFDRVPVSFEPWEDYQARSYTGGGITQLSVYLRD